MIRIVNETGLAGDTRILLEDGRDITRELGVADISIGIDARDGRVRARLTLDMLAVNISAPRDAVLLDLRPDQVDLIEEFRRRAKGGEL